MPLLDSPVSMSTHSLDSLVTLLRSMVELLLLSMLGALLLELLLRSMLGALLRLPPRKLLSSRV